MKRLHVLFVCVGNICRSPMAEAMARTYGSDVLVPSSAGLSPAAGTHATTRSVLKEINIDCGRHTPRRLSEVDLSRCDLVVNMSGVRFPDNVGVPVETWDVKDPYGGDEEDFRRARADIEMQVMSLILRVRAGKVTRFRRNASPTIDGGRASSRQ